jgi:hypothetical protein
MKRTDWPGIFEEWSFLVRGREELLIRFTDVRVSSPGGGLRIGGDIYDWWPRQSVTKRRSALQQNGILGVYWNTPKAMLHTADVLAEHRDNPEAVAAIMVGGSLWTIEKHLPPAWHGRAFELLHTVQREVMYSPGSPFKRFEIPVWHHAMREALPISIIDHATSEFMLPRSAADIVHIAYLDSLLSTSVWTIVNVSHEDGGPRRVEANGME